MIETYGEARAYFLDRVLRLSQTGCEAEQKMVRTLLAVIEAASDPQLEFSEYGRYLTVKEAEASLRRYYKDCCYY